MTGYGRANGTSNGKDIIIELKSLNGKQFEITNKLTPLVKQFEADIRKQLTNSLKRGSLDVSIQIKQDGVAKPMQINVALAKSYYKGISQIAEELGLSNTENILATLMRMPEIVAAETDMIIETDWTAIESILNEAITNLKKHRLIEGTHLQIYLLERIENIATLLTQAEVFEPKRIEKIRERIHGSLEEFISIEKIDMNRLEQELIFYIEKIDISEEKQRLSQHINYFKDLIEHADEEGVGKKLGFVLQEIGREINTMGSKANDADMQQVVVQMKDELEKAKEQVLNIL